MNFSNNIKISLFVCNSLALLTTNLSPFLPYHSKAIYPFTSVGPKMEIDLEHQNLGKPIY